jgi:hypothetical protein
VALTRLSRVVAPPFIVALLLHGCLFVKTSTDVPKVATMSSQQQTVVPMNSEPIRSRKGDILVNIPDTWVFIDTQQGASPDIIAIAVNPEYTLSAVFAGLPQANTTNEEAQREGVLGLARVAYTKHQKKSGGASTLLGTYSKTTISHHEFGVYHMLVHGTMKARNAVFTSSIGEHYEISIVPLLVTGSDVPADSVQQTIFHSILASVQY